MPLLPIKGDGAKEIWGSGDAGRSVLAESEEFNQVMAKVASQLHFGCITLTSHKIVKDGVLVPAPDSKQVKMFTATDLEGCLGTDGNFHMLDFARYVKCKAYCAMFNYLFLACRAMPPEEIGR